MTLTYQDIKNRIFSLVALETSYDERNNPIGSRRLPVPVVVAIDAIRAEYALAMDTMAKLEMFNVNDHVLKDDDGNPVSLPTEDGERYVFKTEEDERDFKATHKEIMETEVQVEDIAVSMEDIMRIGTLQTWVFSAIKWMIRDYQEVPDAQAA